jgi:ribonuclease HI
MSLNSVYRIYKLKIIDKKEQSFLIKISRDRLSCQVLYNPDEKILEFQGSDALSKELADNKYQLTKILHNKRNNTYFPGFKLKFILRNNEHAISLNDLSKLVILDRRNNNHLVSSADKDQKEIFRIYTDGCYLENKKRGAYIALFKKVNNKLNLICKSTPATSSSLIELMAVVHGLECAQAQECIRIVSDSRYIIKGLTEWMFNWKLNNWYTAQGKKVKNIAWWKKFEKLTRGKYIEFEWVKGHSQHYENSICDYYAKQAAMRDGTKFHQKNQ